MNDYINFIIDVRKYLMNKQSSHNQIIIDLTESLKEIEDQVLIKVAEIWGEQQSLHQFHAQIGCRNNDFVDSIRQQFMRPCDYISAWLKGLRKHVQATEEKQRKKYNGKIYQTTSCHKILKCLQRNPTKKYVLKFLERRFYRQLEPTIRAKPIDDLWEIWFGSNPLVWGIFIAPVIRFSKWENDISQIRRVKYHYWTVGHVIQTGFIVPESSKKQSINDLNDIVEFYENICERLSLSQYEKELMCRYITFLNESDDPLNEPFLIPEMRLNKDKKHKYRLDLLVLNSYTMKFTGFEISPASTHIKVAKTKQKSQAEINSELATQWERESDKRNQYYSRYGISVITFTNQHLVDMDSCFDTIKKYLNERVEKLDVDEELKKIRNHEMD